MSPEYGATMGFFPVDEKTIEYLNLIGTDPHRVRMIEAYLKKQGLFRVYDGSVPDPDYSGDIMELDLLEEIESGPNHTPVQKYLQLL